MKNNVDEKLMYFCFGFSAMLLFLNILGIIQTSVVVCLIPVIAFVLFAFLVIVALFVFLTLSLKTSRRVKLEELINTIISKYESEKENKND